MEEERGMTIILIAVIVDCCRGGRYMHTSHIFNKPSGVAQPLAQPTPSGEMVEIVFTTQAIAKGTQFTEQVLTYVPIPGQSW